MVNNNDYSCYKDGKSLATIIRINNMKYMITKVSIINRTKIIITWKEMTSFLVIIGIMKKIKLKL